jgi:uncharacterized protein (TIGR04255 family)
MAGPDVPATIYAHPPLIETWLSVDFAKTDFTEADSQSLRKTLGPEWSGTWKQTLPGSTWQGKQLMNVMADRALRLTERGFAFGWLGYGGEHYPRYESVRDGFVMVLDSLRSQAAEDKKTLIPDHWSVRYVNRIPQGTVWTTIGEWQFYSMWQPAPLKAIGIDPAGFQARWDLPLEGNRGALAIEFRHQSADDTNETDVVWIDLIASGAIENPQSSVFDGLDFGREVIVRSFNELVSCEAKEFWGVRSR